MKKIFSILVTVLPFFSTAQTISTFAGTGTPGYTGDGGQATAASVDGPNGLAIDNAGNVYVSEYWSHTIRKITPSGIISTYAGNNVPGYGGDGGQATAAQLNYPVKIAIDHSGNIFIADRMNNRIRKVATSGIITTVAGDGIAGYNGDGISATSAKISSPTGVDVDSLGNIYIADLGNNRIRKVSGGMIYTIAGTGVAGSSGDGGAATSAELYQCFGVRADRSGNIFITDDGNNKIREVSPLGIISTFAGNGTTGYSGDGGPATDASFNDPAGINFDNSGNVYIADQLNSVIRKVSNSGIITTIVGTGAPGYNGDGIAATAAQINNSNELIFDATQHLLLTDNLNHRVRILNGCISDFTINPVNDTVYAGGTAKYWVRTTLSSPVLQWQQNAGGGWVNMANTWPYSGVTTDTLTIHNASLYIDTTHYRCFVDDDANPCGDTSNAAILYIRHTAGVQNITAEQISIFPDPAHDNFTIQLPGNGTVQIISGIGQMVIEQRVKGMGVISVSDLPNGVYIAKVQIGDQIFYKKIIKD